MWRTTVETMLRKLEFALADRIEGVLSSLTGDQRESSALKEAAEG
jgi:hypothetical protein